MITSGPFPETRPSLLTSLAEAEPGCGDWREFFERYAPPVYRVARRRGLEHHDADDIVQQVMTSVVAHIGGFEYNRDRGRFRQWVRTITEHKISEYVRKARPTCVDQATLASFCDQSAISADDAWKEQWHFQDVLFCIDRVAADVSPRRMLAFRLYAMEGLPAAEVARRVDMSIGNVYVSRTLILNRVRKIMRELDRDSEDTA